ncbi:MAG: ABC transporter ATP-binding protein/permease [Lactobacillales bacterium]|jgi:ATP-binding cassette subfamily B protein|nr:ABC transporter ATP-binding protein/permease [Lactobacillales bacterium]
MAEKKEKEHVTLKEQAKIIKLFYGFLGTRKWLFWLACVIVVFVGIAGAIMPKLIQIYLDTYLSKLTHFNMIIIYFAAIYLAFSVVHVAVNFAHYPLYQHAVNMASHNARTAIFNKVNKFSQRYFDQTPVGSIFTRIANDTDKISPFFLIILFLLLSGSAIVSCFVGMLLINVKIALWALMILPVIVASLVIYQKVSDEPYRLQSEKRSELNTQMNENINGIRIIQQFKKEDYFFERFETTTEDYAKWRMKNIKIDGILLDPLYSMLTLLLIALIEILFARDASAAMLVGGGMMYAFVNYVQILMQNIGQVTGFMSGYSDGVVAGKRMLSILESDDHFPTQRDTDATIGDGRIEFKDFSFSYDGENKVLNNISFVVEPGETVALVGHTGSGKSSIINAFMRFYEYDEGSISIDGVDLKDYKYSELRSKVGLVLQDSVMFYGDIKSNIRLFDESITDEQIVAAAEFVNADRYIERLDGGYDAKVIEGGTSLSSGERQLLSFARTIVTDPKILILDEATANIDTETENVIQESLRRMRNNRSVIAIAHRLSTIKDANKIIVLDHGNIIEMGTHDELIAAGGTYKEMYELQTKD